MWFYLKKLDWILIIAILLLTTIGLLTIYSNARIAPLRSRELDSSIWVFRKQLIFVGIGFLLMFLLALFFDYRILKNNTFALIILYLFSLSLLVGVLFFGKEIRGATSWFRLGELGFEPVEFAKLVVILLLAKYFSLRHTEIKRIIHLVVSAFYVFIPVVLILLQPDLGSVLIFFAIWLGMTILAGIRVRHLIYLGLGGTALSLLSWSFFLKPYQKQRIFIFLNPYSDPLGRGWQVIQSVIAVGAGTFLGKGLGHGSQSQLNFLPEPFTDFIFASIAEEWGFIGSLLVIALFGTILYRIISISLASPNNFARLFGAGFMILLISEIFINLGMNMGLLPITGIPLPLLSYGGSNLICIFIGLGILQSIRLRT